MQHGNTPLKPQFTRSHQDLNLSREHVDNLISCIPLNGKSVDLQPLFFRFTLDTTTALLFGGSVYCLKANDSNDEHKIAEFSTTFESDLLSLRVSCF